MCPSMESAKSLEGGRRDFEPMIMITNLLQLNLRKLWFIQVFIPVRQSVRVERMAGVIVLAEM